MSTVTILVTNDIHQDQRMNRIATTLTKIYQNVSIVGRVYKSQKPLAKSKYKTYRHRCRFQTGMLFYAEIAYRHFRYLINKNPEVVYAVDVDTLLPATLYKILRKDTKLIYDAHEWFTEVPELEGQYLKKIIWKSIEQLGVQQSDIRYTVSPGIAKELGELYGKPFEVVMNVPTQKRTKQSKKIDKTILYQGMLNKGRGLEQMIEAMHFLPDHHLLIVGDGDVMEELQKLSQNSTYDNITFAGWKDKSELHALTQNAWIGINLLEATSKSYYYSLANKFFDYMQAGVPVITMDFPEYRTINKEHDVAELIADLDYKSIVDAVSKLDNPEVYQGKRQNCLHAAQILNWEMEEQKLISYLQHL